MTTCMCMPANMHMSTCRSAMVSLLLKVSAPWPLPGLHINPTFNPGPDPDPDPKTNLSHNPNPKELVKTFMTTPNLDLHNTLSVNPNPKPEDLVETLTINSDLPGHLAAASEVSESKLRLKFRPKVR